jgi:hypothetical protein
MRHTVRTLASLALLTPLAAPPLPAPAAAQPAQPAQPPKVTQSTGTVAKRPAAPRPARRIALADVAGRWAMRVMLMSGDSTLVLHELVATPERTGWTLHFPNRAPIPVRVVHVAGDSIVTEVGPYESVLREGNVQVTTRGVYRLRNGRLHGTTVARYATAGPDSVLRVRIVGAKIQ